jgi:hypothetical protein
MMTMSALLIMVMVVSLTVVGAALVIEAQSSTK